MKTVFFALLPLAFAAFGQDNNLTVKYTLPGGKYVRAVSVASTDKPTVIAHQDGCEIKIASTELGAEAIAKCQVRFKLDRPGRIYVTLRGGTLERDGDLPESYFRIRWDDFVVTTDAYAQ